MPPNPIELPPMETDPEGMIQGAKPIDGVLPPAKYEDKYGLIIIQNILNLLAHILIGMTVVVCFLFAFRNGIPEDGLGSTPLHIVLCVAGYNLMMAEAILALTNENGWSSKLRLIDKRRAHWILQILGSVLAIWGSFHKSLDKNINWNTLHGQFALVALVFTVVSLVNGVTSLWAYECRRFLPGNLSKLTHICFGTVGFSAACICLCYGLDKSSFRGWLGNIQTDTIIAFVGISTFIIIVNPLMTFFKKSLRVITK